MNTQNIQVHFVGPFMQRYEDHIRLMAKLGRPLLIIGETGTGKRQAALIVNDALNMNGLANVNCASMSYELIRSELFGHKRGAFTGAYKDHMGKIETASKDDLVLYLDELGEMNPDAKAVFLNALQERKASPVGSTRSFDISCPIVATTMDESRIGDALLARFQKIYLPPLRLRYDWDGTNYRIDILHLLKAILANDIEGEAIKIDLEVTHVECRLLEDVCKSNLSGNIRALRAFVIDDAVNAKFGKASRYKWTFSDSSQQGLNTADAQRLIPFEDIPSYTPASLKGVSPSLAFTQDISVGKKEITIESCKSFFLREMPDPSDNHKREILLKREGIIPWGNSGMLERDIYNSNTTIVLKQLYKWLRKWKRRLCWGYSLSDILNVCDIIIRYQMMYIVSKQFAYSEYRILEAVEPGAYSRFKHSIGTKMYHQIKVILGEEFRKGDSDFEQRASKRIAELLKSEEISPPRIEAKQETNHNATIERVDTLAELQKQQTVKILREERAKGEIGSKPRAAKRLGISLTTLYDRIKRYCLAEFGNSGTRFGHSKEV